MRDRFGCYAANLGKHGLKPEDYMHRFNAQQGRCRICMRAPEPNRRARFGLVVDHDHRTGAVRGLLCSRCNTGIGLLGDCPNTLVRAANYLRSSNVVARFVNSKILGFAPGDGGFYRRGRRWWFRVSGTGDRFSVCSTTTFPTVADIWSYITLQSQSTPKPTVSI